MHKDLRSALQIPPDLFRSLDPEDLRNLMCELLTREGRLLSIPSSKEPGNNYLNIMI